LKRAMYNSGEIISSMQSPVSEPKDVKVSNKINAKVSKRIIIDSESRVILFVVLALQLLLPNGFYLFVCMATIYLIVYNLQQPLKPGVFTVIALNHFMQIIAGVWQANYVGKDISFRSPNMAEATIASSIGLLFMFLPVYYYQSKLPCLRFSDLIKEAYKLSTGKVFNCYLVAFFIVQSLTPLAFLFGGLTQVIFSFIKVKWLLFLLFGYLSILKKEKRNLFYLFVVLEFLSGFYSYFSEFKTVIYFTVVLLISLIQVVNIKQVIYGSLIAACLLFFALIWTGIKGEYRAFINGGTRQQIAATSKEEALDKLYDLSNNVSEESLNSSVYQFLDRLQYTFHFAKTIERVPAVIPFQRGKNWSDNIEYCTTPRFLNPDKPSLDATEKAKQYTGLHYLGQKYGVSFSLGYFAECYIDFGLWGMMFPLFLIGLMYGLTYWYLMKNASRNYIFNYCVAGAFFLEFFAFEMDGTFFLGRFLATLVTFVFLIKAFFPMIIRYISEPQSAKK